MAERTRGYAHRIEIDAPAAHVWRGLIDPLKLRLWFGPEARVAAREGGSYCVKAASDLERDAHIDVFQPDRRLRLVYMPPRTLPGDDAVLVDDFVLTLEGRYTVLHVLGSGFPVDEAWDRYYERLRGGWPRALARLKVLTEREARGGAPKRAAQGGDAPAGAPPAAPPGAPPAAQAADAAVPTSRSSPSSAGGDWVLID